MVEEALRGELSKSAVSRKHDVNTNLLCRWIREFQRVANWAMATSPTLLPVIERNEIDKVPKPPLQYSNHSAVKHSTSATSMTVTFAAGHRLTISDLSADHLRTLVEALQ